MRRGCNVGRYWPWLAMIGFWFVLGCSPQRPAEEPEWDPIIDRIEVVPREVRLFSLGEESKLFATVWSRDQEVLDVQVVWSSTAPHVVEVDEHGVAYARAEGTAVVQARVRGTDLVAEAEVGVEQLPTRLAFLSQPGDVVAGIPFEPPIRIGLLDGLGNPVRGMEGEVGIRMVGGEETLLGATEGLLDEGVATFQNLAVSKVGEGLRLHADLEGFEPIESEPFRVVHGPAFELVPLEPKVDLALGDEFFVEVEARDAHGNLVPNWSGRVEAWVDGNKGVLEGQTSASAKEARGRLGPIRLGLYASTWNPSCHTGTTVQLEVRAHGLVPARIEVLQRLKVAATKSDGQVRCLLLQDGKVSCSREHPLRREWEALDPLVGEGARSISFDSSEACSLDGEGQVFCQGISSDGLPFPSVRKIVPPAGDFVAGLARGGFSFSCGWSNEGEAFCWGFGSKGQLGNGGFEASLEAVPVVGHRFHEVSTGFFHACGVTTMGRAVCWGSGASGQLGNGELVNQASPVEVSLPGEERVKTIDAGTGTTCAITESERVFCWGELYDSDKRSTFVSSTPILIIRPKGVRPEGIGVGQARACLHAAGDGYCWGWYGGNGYGRLHHTARPEEKIIMPPGEGVIMVDANVGDILSASGRLYHFSRRTMLPVESDFCPAPELLGLVNPN